MKKFILILFAFICFGWVIGKPQGMVAQPLSNSWCWHTDGGFKYPMPLGQESDIRYMRSDG